MHGNQLRSNLTCLNIQIIPQAVCSRYGLAIGAAVTPLVRLLVWICFPVAYPISKVTNLSMCYLHFAILFRFSSQQISIFHYFINPFFWFTSPVVRPFAGKKTQSTLPASWTENSSWPAWKWGGLYLLFLPQWTETCFPDNKRMSNHKFWLWT